MSSKDTFENQFAPYREIKESTDSLYTILIHNSPIIDVMAEVEHRLRLANEMRQSKKKALVCQRLAKFLVFLGTINPNPSIILNSIFLLSDKIDEIYLNKEWITILSEYSVDKFIFKYGTTFDIDYLKDLLTDINFRNVIHVKNNEYTHIFMNSTKKKTHFQKESKSFDLTEYIQKNIKDKCVIHGVSSVLKFFKCEPHWVFTKRLMDEEILDLYKKEEVGKLHLELDKHFSMIQNEKFIHRLVFGKDIEKKIAQMTLQTLYCSPEIYEKVMKRLPKEYFTSGFQIYKVESLVKGDPGDRLKTDFSGAMGITYY